MPRGNGKQPERLNFYVAQALMPGSASRLSPPPRDATREKRARSMNEFPGINAWAT